MNNLFRVLLNTYDAFSDSVVSDRDYSSDSSMFLGAFLMFKNVFEFDSQAYEDASALYDQFIALRCSSDLAAAIVEYRPKLLAFAETYIEEKVA